MNKKIAILGLMLLLTACGEPKNTTTANSEKSSSIGTLQLNDGSKLQYNGKLLYTTDKKTDTGVSRINKIAINSGSKLAENLIFGQLSKLGYTRAVMSSSSDNFKVHYYKTGQSTIGMIYKETMANNILSTNILIYWQTKQ